MIRTKRSAWYLGWIVCPIAAFVGLLGWSIAQELRAKEQLQSSLATMQQRGIPIDNQSLTEQFDAHSDEIRALRWQRLCAAAKGIESTYWIPMLSDKWDDMAKLTPPDVEWKMAPVLESYSRDAAPLIAELRELLDSDAPIWQPVLFKDINTLLPSLQGVRSVARLLAYESRAAFHAGDHQRAIETLQLLPKVADAIDFKNYLVVDFVRVAVIGVQHSLIHDSLAFEVWTVDEIEQLRKQLIPPSDLSEHWSRVVQSEATIVQEAIGIGGQTFDNWTLDPATNFMKFFKVTPIQQLAVLKQLEQFANEKIDFEFGDLNEVVAMERELSSLRAGISLVSIPMSSIEAFVGTLNPAYQAYAGALSRTARDHRWTMCALAIKQFQLQTGRWPHSLEELKQVGLSREDWLAKVGVPFGYQAGDDTKPALLWTIQPTAGIYEISSKPPSVVDPDHQSLELIEFQIR